MAHGGDIYRNRVELDFSVNVNPFGMPERVREALVRAADGCVCYPDARAEALTHAVCERLGVPGEELVWGNGASELFVAAVRALAPGKAALVAVPCFSGYARAVRMCGCPVVYYTMRESDRFALTEEIGLVFLANPNNPTGNVVERTLLLRIAKACREKGIPLVLDECFIAFTGDAGDSFLPRLEEFPNVILVRAFTKLFAVPGVRLGYLLCSDRELARRIREQLPEWNLSVPAQAAGLAACRETAYVEKSVAFVCEEREWLAARLAAQGIQVFPSRANFLFLRSERKLSEELLERGILIRDCSDLPGLGEGWWRVAVRRRGENERLLRALAGVGETACPKKEEAAVRPEEIERRSFAIIAEELARRGISPAPDEDSVIRRVIHTSADFSYARTLVFSQGAIAEVKRLIRAGADIVTDTRMASVGINQKELARYGGRVHCFMADEETAQTAQARGITRAAVCMERAARLEGPVIFAIGNAPTALLRLHEMLLEGRYRPAFVIGVPVGFVNVEAAKERILQTDVPCIVNRGRKGGSGVAAAVCNAILYELKKER